MSDHAPLYAVLILALGLGIVLLCFSPFSSFDDTQRTLIESPTENFSIRRRVFFTEIRT